MHTIAKLLPFLIVFGEGYTTLAVQMIVLRVASPVLGTNVASTSIIIGVMLVALSIGYWRGGEVSSKLSKTEIQNKLTRNFLASGLLFAIGLLLFPSITESLLTWNENYFLSVFLSSLITLFIPVYLASETTPLVSELLKNIATGQAVGRLIFFSTIGSFLGSVLTTIVFFPWIGVEKNIALVVLIFGVLSLAVSKNLIRKFLSLSLIGMGIMWIGGGFSTDASTLVYKKSTPYQDISISDTKKQNGQINRLFSLDGAYSSGLMNIHGERETFRYLEAAIKITEFYKPKRILVIGGAGFVYPLHVGNYDWVERVDVSEIDPALQGIAEKYFLEEKLPKKIHTSSLGGARYFLASHEEKYDMILIDAYAGQTIPQELVTKEFFNLIQSHLSENGTVVFNAIIDPEFTSSFSQGILSTLQEVYGNIYADILAPTGKLSNVLISNQSIPNGHIVPKKQGTIYTDDQNSAGLDIVEMNIVEKRR